jgi:deoxyhypusine monooxygenase
MTDVIFDEYQIRKLPPRERLDFLKQILTNNTDEASTRWDCVWLAGEIADELPSDVQIRQEIADLMVWVLKNDENDIVSHEAAFQIGLRNMVDKMSDLLDAALHHKGVITRHEAIEGLCLARRHEYRNTIESIAHDKTEPEPVRVTAAFVVERLDKLKNAGVYRGGPV